ncbi:MAG: hypothetical protein AAF560_29580 [Acidobacteriota bacterium]
MPAATAGGAHSVQLELRGEHPLYSNQILDFHVLPVIESLTETTLLPGDVLEIHGSGFTPGSEILIGTTGYSATLVDDNPPRLTFQLPDRERFPFAEGEHTLTVVNEDGGRSNSVTIEFDLKLIVPVRAWRVVPDLHVAPFHLRSSDWIRKIFNESPSVNEVWNKYGIEIAFDDRIDDAVLPFTLAYSFPPLKSDFNVSAVVKEKDEQGDFRHYQPDVINIYFVQEIAGFFLWGYATKQWIIFQDTKLHAPGTDALIMAHEIGHSLSLNHVCHDEEDSLFKRSCKSQDSLFLMHPHANKGNELTETEAIRARKNAEDLYRKSLGRS